mgnify:CR=1 FL=1
MLSYKRRDACVDEGLELNVGDRGEGKMEHVDGTRANGREEAVEED